MGIISYTSVAFTMFPLSHDLTFVGRNSRRYKHVYDLCDGVSAASHADVEVDQSRRHGYARIQVVGGLWQSLAVHIGMR